MLVGGQHRQADQREPAVQGQPRQPVQVLRIAHPQHHQQHDVQRRRLVERLVEAEQHREQPAEHALGRRPLETEAQRPQQEAAHRQQLRGEQTPRMRVQFDTRAADEERDHVEQVDRPVRDDGPRPERDLGFPGERQRRHGGATRGQRVGQAVAEEEERPQQRQPGQRPPPRPRGRGAHGAIRCASDTVKMPHSSMRCSSLRKPAARTSSSISCWVRRRITQAAPPR
ncbi:hypothetical protein NB710_000359 [Xanthomonas sacchari]|nr:hypothetical protein [Xanthomonas sacchari]